MASSFRPKQILLKASTVSVAARIVTTLLSVSIVALLSKVLAPTDLAIYWIFISVLSLIALIAQFGLGQVVISDVSQSLALDKTEEAHRTTASAAVLVLLIGAVSAVVIFGLFLSGILGDAFTRIPPQIVALMAFGAIICSVSILIIDLLKARMRLTLSSFLAAQPASGGVIPSSIFLFSLLVLLFWNNIHEVPLFLVCLLFICGWLLLLIIGDRQLHLFNDFRQAAWVIHWPEVARLLKSSAPIATAAVAMYVITQADLWFVFSYLEPAESATYGIAASFVKYVSAVNILIGALLPGLVGHMWANQDVQALRKLLRRLARIGAAAALFILIVIAVWGHDILFIIVGSEYTGALAPLLVLSVGHLINALMGYPQVLIITVGLRSQILYASLAAGLVTVFGLFFAVPIWGMIGAATVTTAGFVLYGLIISVVCIRQTGIHCHVFARA